MSLRTRLFLGLTLLVVAAVGSATWAIGVLGQHRIEVALSGRVLELAQPILATLEEATTLAEASVRATRLQQRGVAQEIVLGDPSGQRSDGGVADPRMVAAASSAPFVVHSGEQAFAYAPLRRDGRLFGVVRIRAGSDDSTRLWRELAPLAWAIALVDIGLILLFGGLFLRRVIDPLRGLSDAAMRVAEGLSSQSARQNRSKPSSSGRFLSWRARRISTSRSCRWGHRQDSHARSAIERYPASENGRMSAP